MAAGYSVLASPVVGCCRLSACVCARVRVPARYVTVLERTDDVINVAAHRLSCGSIEEVRQSLFGTLHLPQQLIIAADPHDMDWMPSLSPCEMAMLFVSPTHVGHTFTSVHAFMSLGHQRSPQSQ